MLVVDGNVDEVEFKVERGMSDDADGGGEGDEARAFMAAPDRN